MQTQHFQRDQCKARHRYDISSICHLGWIVFRQLGSGEYADELPLAVTIKSPAGESCRRHKEMAKTTRADVRKQPVKIYKTNMRQTKNANTTSLGSDAQMLLLEVQHELQQRLSELSLIHI